MAAPMVHMTDKKLKANFSMRSGASLISVKPVFAHDNKYLFVCSANVIKVYSTASGECYRELVGHEAIVTGVVIHPKNKLQILSCSKEKSIIVWDYADGIKLRSIIIGRSSIGIFTCSLKDTVYLLTTNTTEGSTDKSCVLIEKSLTQKGGKHREILADCFEDVHKIAIGPKGSYCASVQNAKLVVKSVTGRKSLFFTHLVEENQSFTCVSCHPDGNSIATGSIDGVIFLWYEFLTRNAVKTTLHWHSLPVRELTYTPEGSYLLSGGHECVLVKWHLHTEYRDFLPRLGAPINFLVTSKDNQLYAISQDDNVIQVVSSSFSVQQVYQGLTRSKSNTIPTGLRCDPRTQALVLNGKPGHIQFYSVHDDKQLFNLDIVCQNYVSAESLDKSLIYTEITHVEFDEKGQWLSTVEYWNDGQMSPEIRLKFWVFSEENQSYTLNTIAEQAHSDLIQSLKFRPIACIDGLSSPNMVVTSSVDGKFKIWTLTDDTDIYRENVKWTCQSVGFYRDIPAGETAFSEDGTLLAVVFDSCITLWDPDTNLLRETLVSNVHQSKINHILFGNHNCSQYIVSCTKNILTVWNLITCSISWSADYSVVSIAKDPLSDNIAAFSTEKRLNVFKPSDPKPGFTYSSVCSNPVINSVYIPHSQKDLYKDTVLSWQEHSELYFMDNSQQLFSVSLQGNKQQEKSKEDVITIEENLPQSALSLIMQGHTNKSALRVDEKNVTLKPHDRYLREILTSPAHVQPSVSTLCQPFLRSLLVPLPNSIVKGDADNEDDDGDDKTYLQESQTGSVDSGLDSDSDMDTSENQSSETGPALKTQTVPLSNNVSGENCLNKGIPASDLEQQKRLSQQQDVKSVSMVFQKSLSWYTE